MSPLRIDWTRCIKRGVLIIRQILVAASQKRSKCYRQAILALHRDAKPDPLGLGPGKSGDNNPKFKLHR
jgi:hypothetical protein